MADNDVPWDLVSRVRSSRRKSEMINWLGEEPAAATEIASRMRIKRESVSNIFRELKKTEPPLIKCLTPTQPHHRIYGLTSTGELVKEHVEEP